MALINVKVQLITQEANGVQSFLLTKKGLFKLPGYTAGAHIDVHCGEGIIRQYSLCGDPNDRRHYLIAVKQVEPSRGGSDLMHTAVREGDRLEIGSPRNKFPLDETKPFNLLLAAGIGITPIIAMADRLHAIGKPFELHYFSRGAGFTAFRDRLKTGPYSSNVFFHEGVDAARTRAQLQNLLKQCSQSGQVYLCGPAPFMEVAEQFALENLPADAVNLERFSANPAIAGAPNFPFQIELARSGTVLQVAADQTILEVLERNQIDAAFSCEQGVCGTCVTKVVEGVPDHRDSFLNSRQKESQSRMCICVSRAAGNKLVLDL